MQARLTEQLRQQDNDVHAHLETIAGLQQQLQQANAQLSADSNALRQELAAMNQRAAEQNTRLQQLDHARMTQEEKAVRRVASTRASC
jgi:hypothetical protein